MTVPHAGVSKYQLYLLTQMLQVVAQVKAVEHLAEYYTHRLVCIYRLIVKDQCTAKRASTAIEAAVAEAW